MVFLTGIISCSNTTLYATVSLCRVHIQGFKSPPACIKDGRGLYNFINIEY